MRHPIGDEARRLIAWGQIGSAARRIAQALTESPTDPDLLTEEWICRALSFNLDLDPSHLDALIGAPRYPRVVAMALTYARSRACVAPKEWESIVAALQERYASLTPDEVVPLTDSAHAPRISAVMIVKNEEAMLEECLASLRGAVDEIVVVDTGSTDSTMEIAKAHGAILGSFKWCDDFALARNASLELATGDWALWIDADERLTPATVDLIREASFFPFIGGYFIEIISYTDDRANGDQFTHSPVRMFRRTDRTLFTGAIHEQVMGSLENQGLPCVVLPGACITHEGYRPQALRDRDKLTRTIRLLENEVRSRPQDGFQWFNLANALLTARRFSEAEHAASTAIRQISAGSNYGELAYQIRVTALMEIGRYDEALVVCDDADQRGFGGVLNDFERASLLQRMGRLEEALVAVDRCLATAWPANRAGDRGILTHKRHVLRGQILTLLGRSSEALPMFEHALMVDPGFVPTIFSKAIALERLGHFDEAEELFLQTSADESVVTVSLKGLARVRAGKNDLIGAAKYYRQAWEGRPEDHEAWVGWANSCESQGDVNGVVEAFEAFAKHHTPTPGVLVNWGRALDRAGETDRALELIAEAIRREPNEANAYFNCGDILYRLERYADSAHLYECGLRIQPSHADGWFTLGNCLAQLGLLDGAQTAYSQAMALNPKHPLVQHNMDLVRELAAA